jgi:uncharacterized membrane protein
MEYLNGILSVLCHREPLRSFAYNGEVILCARCTGLYGGFFIAAVVMFYDFYKHKAPVLFTKKLLLFSSLLVFITPSEIFVNAFSTFKSPNYVRLITGLLLGEGLAIPSIALWLSFVQKYNPPSGMDKSSAAKFIWLAFFSLLFCLTVPHSEFLDITLSLAGILSVFLILNTNVIYSFIHPSRNSLLTKLVFALSVILLAGAELAAIAYLKKHGVNLIL